MSDSLHDGLTSIHGIGDAKADQILDLVDASDAGVDIDELREHLEDAHDHLEAGRPGYADKFVRRALDIVGEREE